MTILFVAVKIMKNICGIFTKTQCSGITTNYIQKNNDYKPKIPDRPKNLSGIFVFISNLRRLVNAEHEYSRSADCYLVGKSVVLHISAKRIDGT